MQRAPRQRIVSGPRLRYRRAMGADAVAELAELTALAREIVAWEEELVGDAGLSHVAGAPRPAPPIPVDSSTRIDVATPSAGAPVAPSRAQATASRGARLEVLQAEAAECTRCGLGASRTRSVFARGSADAEIVFVGEGPGFHEDQRGVPFVGRAGQLLDKMVSAMGYGRDEVYVCNVVKCRPPDNRTPVPMEAEACLPFLVQQIEIVRPRVIVALGKCAAENLGCVDPEARRWRGVWRSFRGVPVMPTYHPAFLLRSPQHKRPVWEDLQQVMARVGRAPR